MWIDEFRENKTMHEQNQLAKIAIEMWIKEENER